MGSCMKMISSPTKASITVLGSRAVHTGRELHSARESCGLSEGSLNKREIWTEKPGREGR